ncbi:hypothetical protein MHU86_18453 [Fragilaria crotonensis]|nr:hypothetical protein MHU86_18453 [Fragilaria crotonensis]
MTVNAKYAAIIAVLLSTASAFAPINTLSHSSITTSTVLHEGSSSGGGFFDAIGDFFNELDAFVDDATSRRLGSGSAFYGKRKSSFYGKNDKNRKSDRDMPDPAEDYQGPAKSGYFQWMQDEETGEMKPVTRLKKKNIERNPNYWDRVFDKDDTK